MKKFMQKALSLVLAALFVGTAVFAAPTAVDTFDTATEAVEHTTTTETTAGELSEATLGAISTEKANALKYGLNLFSAEATTSKTNNTLAVSEDGKELTWSKGYSDYAFYSNANATLYAGNEYTFVADVTAGDATKLLPILNNSKPIDDVGTASARTLDSTGVATLIPSTDYNTSNFRLGSTAAGSWTVDSFGVYYKPTAAEATPEFTTKKNVVTVSLPEGVCADQAKALVNGSIENTTAVVYDADAKTLTLTVADTKLPVWIPELVNAAATKTYPETNVGIKAHDNYAALYGVKVFFEDFAANEGGVVSATLGAWGNVNLHNAETALYTGNEYTLFIGGNSSCAEKSYYMIGEKNKQIEYLATVTSTNKNVFSTDPVITFTVPENVTYSKWNIGTQLGGTVVADEFGLYYKPGAKEAAITPVYNYGAHTVSITYPNGVNEESLYALEQNPEVVNGVTAVKVNGNTVAYSIEIGKHITIPSLVNAAKTATYAPTTLFIDFPDNNALTFGVKIAHEEYDSKEVSIAARWGTQSIIKMDYDYDLSVNKYFVFVSSDTITHEEYFLANTTKTGTADGNGMYNQGYYFVFDAASGKWVATVDKWAESYGDATSSTTDQKLGTNQTNGASFDITEFGIYYKPIAADTIGEITYRDDGYVEVSYPNGIDKATVNTILVAPEFVGADFAEYDDGVLSLSSVDGDVIELPELVNAERTATYPTLRLAPKTTNEASIRVSDPTGLRFMGSISTTLASGVDRYGFIVTREDFLTDYGTEYVTDLTHDCYANGEFFAMIEGVVYDKDEKSEAVLFDQNDEELFFAGVVTNIPNNADSYKAKLVCRTYVYANGVYFYGEKVTKSVREIALSLVESGTADTLVDEQKAFIYNAAGIEMPA